MPRSDRRDARRARAAHPTLEPLEDRFLLSAALPPWMTPDPSSSRSAALGVTPATGNALGGGQTAVVTDTSAEDDRDGKENPKEYRQRKESSGQQDDPTPAAGATTPAADAQGGT